MAAGFSAEVFLAAGFLAAAVAGFFAVGFFVAALPASTFFAFLRGSVFSMAVAGVGGGAAGAEACCLAASCQFGKNNSILWREMELARRQRGQCAS